MSSVRRNTKSAAASHTFDAGSASTRVRLRPSPPLCSALARSANRSARNGNTRGVSGGGACARLHCV